MIVDLITLFHQKKKIVSKELLIKRATRKYCVHHFQLTLLLRRSHCNYHAVLMMLVLRIWYWIN